MALGSYDLSRKVLVTQASTRNGFVITYALGKMGVPVYCADAAKYAQSRFSRFCRNYSTHPSPHVDPEGYFVSINRIIEKENISLLFPAYDEMIFLAQNRHRLSRPEVLVCSQGDHVAMLHNKKELNSLCGKIGCNTPLTIELTDAADIERVLEIIDFPFVLKPERGGGGWGVSFITNAKELRAQWEAFDVEKHQNRLFIQQYIKGALFGYGALCDKGTILAGNCYHTVRQYPIGRGTPSFRKGCVVEDIESQAEKIFSHLGWTGVCQFDFLYSENDGKAYLIDANPRFWGSTAHGLASGINFPFLLYLLGTGQHHGSTVRRTGIDVTSLWFWGDLCVMLNRLRTEKGKLKILNDHISTWIGAYYDDFKIDDPLPFIFYPIQKLLSSRELSESEGF